MLCFTYANNALTKGIANTDFYSPLFSGTIMEGSIRIIAGADYDVQELGDAILRGEPHALLCCLVEIIPPTGNKSTTFPENTMMLSVATEDLAHTQDGGCVVFASEHKRVLYGCRPDVPGVFLKNGDIIRNTGETLELIKSSDVPAIQRDAYAQYAGQNITVLELL